MPISLVFGVSYQLILSFGCFPMLIFPKHLFQGNIKLCQWVCRANGTQHRLQGELCGSWNAHVFFCFVDTTSSKAALERDSGPDCISAEHLLYADESLRFFLSQLFNMCIVHGYVPNSCLNTTIVPICKNKNGNMSDISNYRPVAVATVVSKLLEHFILSSISPFLGTTDNQLGFRLGWENPIFFKKTTHLGFFWKNVFLGFLKSKILFFCRKQKNPIPNCCYSVMQYHYLQNYTILTCYTYYGIQNWRQRNVPHLWFHNVLLVSSLLSGQAWQTCTNSAVSHQVNVHALLVQHL